MHLVGINAKLARDHNDTEEIKDNPVVFETYGEETLTKRSCV